MKASRFRQLGIWIAVAVLLPATVALSDPGEDFPPSSFGRPPARGLMSGWPDNATPDTAVMDYDAGRSPAAMDFGSGSVSQTNYPAPPARNLAPPSQEPDLTELASRNGVQEVALIASDLGYFPKTIFVSRDVPVRLYVTGASKDTLCFMMESFQIRKEVRSQKIEEISFVPSVPGKYRFYCPVNGMEGTMVVKEFSASAAARVPASDLLN